MSQRFLGMVFAGAFLLVAGHGVAQASTPQDLDVIQRIDQGSTRAGTGASHSGMTSCGGNTNTTVWAQNNIESGDVNGGNGGSVTVTLTNVDSVPIQLHLRAGDGGDGGRSGEGQGADQAEDLGEYAGQTNPTDSNNQIQTSTETKQGADAPAEDIGHGVGPSRVRPDTIRPGATCDGNTDTSLDAVNSIVSGSANGGNGGDIYLIINAN